MKATQRLTLAPLTALLRTASPAAHAGLVAHYRFDGELKDATGRRDGRPVDAQRAPVFAPGRVGSAVVIERANAGIEAANPAAIAFSRDFTIAAWVNCAAAAWRSSNPPPPACMSAGPRSPAI